MAQIAWTGTTTRDHDVDATVHRVDVDGQQIAVYVSDEVTEDGLPYQEVAEAKIEEAIAAAGSVPTKIRVARSDFPQ